MTGMAKGVSPMEETTGKLSAAYHVRVEVDRPDQIPAAAEALEAPLRRAVAESYPGEAGSAVVHQVESMLPPSGSHYTGWTTIVVVLIDLTAWRRDVGPTNGQHASVTVRDLLADADLTGTGARIDSVGPPLLVHAPS
jgi:hypothetical protein